jgi:hypothetical protein
LQLRTVQATRYVTPLKEGGSLPAIVEADDAGMYVLKFRGAGQGPKALIAELLGGELARATGLRMPEIVFMEIDADLARTEPDPEIQQLSRNSAGLNIALDYLPGAVMFDPVAEQPAPELAAAIVWLDALITNVDRTARNTNLLVWHGQLHLIDHGAALYFHHAWNDDFLQRSQDPFALIKDHVLLQFCSAEALREADRTVAGRITPELITQLTTMIPESWLSPEPGRTVASYRCGYHEYLQRRLAEPRTFVEEAVRARSLLV